MKPWLVLCLSMWVTNCHTPPALAPDPALPGRPTPGFTVTHSLDVQVIHADRIPAAAIRITCEDLTYRSPLVEGLTDAEGRVQLRQTQAEVRITAWQGEQVLARLRLILDHPQAVTLVIP